MIEGLNDDPLANAAKVELIKRRQRKAQGKSTFQEAAEDELQRRKDKKAESPWDHSQDWEGLGESFADSLTLSGRRLVADSLEGGKSGDDIKQQISEFASRHPKTKFFLGDIAGSIAPGILIEKALVGVARKLGVAKVLGKFKKTPGVGQRLRTKQIFDGVKSAEEVPKYLAARTGATAGTENLIQNVNRGETDNLGTSVLISSIAGGLLGKGLDKYGDKVADAASSATATAGRYVEPITEHAKRLIPGNLSKANRIAGEVFGDLLHEVKGKVVKNFTEVADKFNLWKVRGGGVKHAYEKLTGKSIREAVDDVGVYETKIYNKNGDLVPLSDEFPELVGEATGSGGIIAELGAETKRIIQSVNKKFKNRYIDQDAIVEEYSRRVRESLNGVTTHVLKGRSRSDVHRQMVEDFAGEITPYNHITRKLKKRGEDLASESHRLTKDRDEIYSKMVELNKLWESFRKTPGTPEAISFTKKLQKAVREGDARVKELEASIGKLDAEHKIVSAKLREKTVENLSYEQAFNEKRLISKQANKIFSVEKIGEAGESSLDAIHIGSAYMAYRDLIMKGAKEASEGVSKEGDHFLQEITYHIAGKEYSAPAHIALSHLDDLTSGSLGAVKHIVKRSKAGAGSKVKDFMRNASYGKQSTRSASIAFGASAGTGLGGPFGTLIGAGIGLGLTGSNTWNRFVTQTLSPKRALRTMREGVTEVQGVAAADALMPRDIRALWGAREAVVAKLASMTGDDASGVVTDTLKGAIESTNIQEFQQYIMGFFLTNNKAFQDGHFGSDFIDKDGKKVILNPEEQKQLIKSTMKSDQSETDKFDYIQSMNKTGYPA